MDEKTKARLVESIREDGDRAVAESLVEPAEVEAAIAAAERGDEREARRFFLLTLCRMTEAWDI